MPTFLFNEIIFGPVQSRRLGISLGINLLPLNRKACSFDCIYCECGLIKDDTAFSKLLPKRNEVQSHLEQKLSLMAKTGKYPDVITFAGNGEPTIHPEFAGIINDTIELRDKFCKGTRVAVLSNSTRVKSPQVFDALLRVDDNIQKLDSAIPATIRLLNRPREDFNLEETANTLKKFEGRVIIQTLFTRGIIDGQRVDNTTLEEIEEWLKLVKQVAPREVMIYTIARFTPVDSLEKIGMDELNKIADQVKMLGIATVVSH